MVLKRALLAAGLATVFAQTESTTCHDYVIVSTRGTFELQGPSVGYKDMIAYTLGNVTGGVEYDTVYPAAQNQTYYLGSNDIVNYINNGVQNCPSQKYLVLGYSQGASATGAALHNYTDTNSAAYKAIAGVLVIGNPYKIPNKDQDVDNLGGTSNRQWKGALYDGELPDVYGNGIPDIYYSSGKLLDICFMNDPICAPQSPDANLTAHLLYAGSYSVQNMGAKFLVNQLTSSNGTANGTSPSGSMVSGMPSATATSTSTTTSSTATPTGLATALQPGLWTTGILALVAALFA